MSILDSFFRELSASFPEIAVPGDARRQTAIEAVQKLVRDSIFAEYKDQENTASGESSLSASESLMRREDLILKVLPATMHEACRLSTETLEYIASQIKEVTGYKDWLHESLPQYPRWEKVAGRHADIMVRDCVFLRDCKGMHFGATPAHSLLEIYAVLGIQQGEIHLVTDQPQLDTVRVLFNVSGFSRRLGDAVIKKGINSSQRSSDFGSAYRMNLTTIHISDEATQYLSSRPEHMDRLMEYMKDRDEILSAVDFDHFTEYMHTSSSISSGVL